MAAEIVKQLIDAGVHFGHHASRWNPKMQPYIFGKKNLIHIINVKETLKGLLAAKKFITQVVAQGKDIVVVGTKRQARKAIEENSPPPRVAPRGIDRIHDNYLTIRHVMKSHLLDEFGPDIDAVISSRIGRTAAQVQKDLAGHPAIDRDAIHLRKMIGRKVDDRPYDFIESLVGHAMIAKLCGYRGLVITIDEFEVEYTGYTTEFGRVRDLLSVLEQYLRGELDHEAAPLAIFVASVGQAGHYGDEILTKLSRITGSKAFVLQPMKAKDYKLLGQKIHELYRSAYGIKGAPKHDIVSKAQDEIDLDYADQESGETRIFIKNLLARCDAMYGPCGHA